MCVLYFQNFRLYKLPNLHPRLLIKHAQQRSFLDIGHLFPLELHMGLNTNTYDQHDNVLLTFDLIWLCDGELSGALVEAHLQHPHGEFGGMAQ